MKSSETLNSALEAMKEQDKLLGNINTGPKILMSIETYEQMQNDPERAKEIYNKILEKPEDAETQALNKAKEIIKKW